MQTTTADLADELGARAETSALQFTDFGGVVRFSGRVRTVRCSGDNALIIRAVAEKVDGQVLVVDGGGRLDVALMGDQYAGLAVSNGWSGVVVVGAVRDAAELARMPLGVKALGTNPRRAAKDGVGEVEVDLVIGGARVSPGDLIHCDEDGILVERGRGDA